MKSKMLRYLFRYFVKDYRVFMQRSTYDNKKKRVSEQSFKGRLGKDNNEIERICLSFSFLITGCWLLKKKYNFFFE